MSTETLFDSKKSKHILCC